MFHSDKSVPPCTAGFVVLSDCGCTCLRFDNEVKAGRLIAQRIRVFGRVHGMHTVIALHACLWRRKTMTIYHDIHQAMTERILEGR